MTRCGVSQIHIVAQNIPREVKLWKHILHVEAFRRHAAFAMRLVHLGWKRLPSPHFLGRNFPFPRLHDQGFPIATLSFRWFERLSLNSVKASIYTPLTLWNGTNPLRTRIQKYEDTREYPTTKALRKDISHLNIKFSFQNVRGYSIVVIAVFARFGTMPVWVCTKAVLAFYVVYAGPRFSQRGVACSCHS